MAQSSVCQNFIADGTSAVKALRVLEYVAGRSSVELCDLAAATGMPKPSVLRLLASLIEEDYVERIAHGRYKATLKLWRIAAGIVDPERVQGVIRPVVESLVGATGETAVYSIYEGGRVIYIDKVDGLEPIRAFMQIGSTAPAYASATGKALLACRSDEEIRRVAEQSERFTNLTNVGFDAILAAAEQTRRDGFAINRGEWRTGVWGIAAPIRDRVGSAMGAIGISGPEQRIAGNLDHHLAVVMAHAEQLSRASGALTSVERPDPEQRINFRSPGAATRRTSGLDVNPGGTRERSERLTTKGVAAKVSN